MPAFRNGNPFSSHQPWSHMVVLVGKRRHRQQAIQVGKGVGSFQQLVFQRLVHNNMHTHASIVLEAMVRQIKLKRACQHKSIYGESSFMFAIAADLKEGGVDGVSLIPVNKRGSGTPSRSSSCTESMLVCE